MSFPASMVDIPRGSVAVIANFYAGLFGGPLSQLLKCLAAVKVCAEFKKNGTDAIPVFLVRRDSPPGFSSGETHLIDRGSKLHCLKSAGREEGTPGTIIAGEDAKRLYKEIEKIFPDGDREALSALKETFVSNTNSISTCVRWLKYLMKEYAATIVEYDILSVNNNSGTSENQSVTLPVSALVFDSTEIEEHSKLSLENKSVTMPVIRTCPSVTISNARNLKTLKRYGLDFTWLLDGKEREVFGGCLMTYVLEAMKSDIPDRAQKLRDATRTILDELVTTSFASSGERSGRVFRERAARIIYQLEKIQRHSRDAVINKEKAAEERIRKACDFLAPLGRRQQDVLGGAQIPLFYGLAGLRALYDSLDITTQNHQLIEMN